MDLKSADTIWTNGSGVKAMYRVSVIRGALKAMTTNLEFQGNILRRSITKLLVSILVIHFAHSTLNYVLQTMDLVWAPLWQWLLMPAHPIPFLYLRDIFPAFVASGWFIVKMRWGYVLLSSALVGGYSGILFYPKRRVNGLRDTLLNDFLGWQGGAIWIFDALAWLVFPVLIFFLAWRISVGLGSGGRDSH